MSGGKGFDRREVPWCTIFLVSAAIACHTAVLVGNLRTAAAMEDMGVSTKGWSNVGLGVSRAFQVELDVIMGNVSDKILGTLKEMNGLQETIDIVLSLIGNATEGAVDKSKALLLLQGATIDPSGLGPLVIKSIDTILEDLMQKVKEGLDKFLVAIKPALLQVGEWILKFSDKIQSGVESFSVSLDRVQKIFDQVMAQLNGKGNNKKEMLQETFNLFDVTGNGLIGSDDLGPVARLYSISALVGDKPDELVKKYDYTGRGELTIEEMEDFVEDPSIPNSMPVLLRSYASRLAGVAGQLASAYMIDEVALSVVRYLQLDAAKNRTKLEWIAQAMSNGSLPVSFTAATMAQLCLTHDDPDALTTLDIAELTLGKMVDHGEQQVLQALDTVANDTWWSTNGFNPFDQPRCLRSLTKWITDARLERANRTTALLQGAASLASRLASLDREVLDAMPAMAERLAEQQLQQSMAAQVRARADRRKALFSSRTSQLMLTHLLGGVAAGDTKNVNLERALHRGQRAAPEALQFTDWLAYNLSDAAKGYNEMAFRYSSQSSSALDSFATQIQGMVKKIQSFLEMTKKWASPEGIARLEDMVKDFADHALHDVLHIVEHRISEVVNNTIPELTGSLHNAAETAGESLGRMIGSAVGEPLAGALVQPLGNILGSLTGSNETGQKLGNDIAPVLGHLVTDATGEMIGNLLKPAFGNLVDKAVDAVGNVAEGLVKTITPPEETHEEAHEEAAHDEVAALLVQVGTISHKRVAASDAWSNVVTTLKTLSNILPTATETLKFARKEVSKAVSNLDNIFGVFVVKGPGIFDKVATLWSMLWTAYFLFLTPLTLLMLYYGLWSHGFFGGPQPIPEDEVQTEPPTTLLDRAKVCWRSCGICMSRCHDTQLCLWSTVILLQVLVLLVFVISIVLCIVAGVKAFITSGCAQVYLLTDPTVCSETIGTLRAFLSKFFVSDAVEQLDSVCPENNLLTCALISEKMKSSTMLTTVFSFLGALVSLQMIIESATLHEQARYRRMHNKFIEEEAREKGLSGKLDGA